MNEDAPLNLQERAYQLIRRSIIRLEYKPGEKLVLKDLCDRLNVGRTPVRESLVRLQQEGLVHMLPQSGTFVAPIDLDTAESARFVREHLEREVAIECCAVLSAEGIELIDHAIALQEQARSRSDQADFFASDNLMHQAFFDTARRSTVWRWLSGTNADLERYRLLRVQTSELEWSTIIDEHHAIREAIVARKPNEVGYLISQHLHMMFEDQKRVVETFGPYFNG